MEGGPAGGAAVDGLSGADCPGGGGDDAGVCASCAGRADPAPPSAAPNAPPRTSAAAIRLIATAAEMMRPVRILCNAPCTLSRTDQRGCRVQVPFRRDESAILFRSHLQLARGSTGDRKASRRVRSVLPFSRRKAEGTRAVPRVWYGICGLRPRSDVSCEGLGSCVRPQRAAFRDTSIHDPRLHERAAQAPAGNTERNGFGG